MFRTLAAIAAILWAGFVSSASLMVDNQYESRRTYAQMLKLGEIRMAVPYERIIYVESKKQILGDAPEIVKYFSSFLSKKYQKQIKVTLVPTTPGNLLRAIDLGKADFALIYTHEYDKQLQSGKYLRYTRPHYEESLIVSKAGTPPINSLLDLSGQDVCVSRFKDTKVLIDANQTLIQSGKKPINIYQDKHALDDEDFLQMLNGGLISYTYVASWKAELWKPYFPNMQINEESKSPGGSAGDLVVRNENKALAEDVLSFAASPDLEEALKIYRKNEFNTRRDALKSPVTPVEWTRFEDMLSYFRLYGNQNRLDPLFLASLGFQESMLNQNAISPTGAIGVMQLLPSTGQSLDVGNIHLLGPNIHAGAKYLSSLVYALSIDGELSDIERNFFAVAAYNAGPNNIRKARELARTMGFDPNKWFENVEMTTAKLFGIETFLYVRNVYKYYVVYDIRQRNISITQENLNPERSGD
jgi:membrane-bound lytic murein transglycosylase MltF